MHGDSYTKNNLSNAIVNLNKWFLLTIFVTFLLIVFEFYPALFKGYYISGDNRIELFPYHRFYDKTLFANADGLPEIMTLYLPLGYTLLYFILSRAVSLYSATLIMPFVLALITVAFIYRIAKHLTRSDVFGFFFSIIFLLLYLSSDSGKGGTIRAFGFLFVSAFLFYLMRGARLKTYFVVLISCWFYPITLGIFLCSLFLDFICAWIKLNIKQKRKELLLGLVIFLMLLSINLVFLLKTNPISPFSKHAVQQYSQEEIDKMPEFGMNGPADPYDRLIRNKNYIFSLPFIYDQLLYLSNYSKKAIWIWPVILITNFFVVFILKKIFSKRNKLAFQRYLTVFSIIWLIIASIVMLYFKITETYGTLIWLLIAIGLTIIAIRGKRALEIIPVSVWQILAASSIMFIILYSLPHNISANLHYPARQLVLIIPLFLIIFCGYNLYEFFSNSLNFISRLFLYLFSTLFIFFYLLNYNSSLYFAKDKDLYNYISNLPKDAIIAGHPEQMDFIPFFGKRWVLACREIDPSFGKQIWYPNKEKIFDIFSALYSKNSEDFNKFCAKYKDKNIFFVVDKFYFSREYLNSGRLYFDPFNNYIRKITKSKAFFLPGVANHKKVFISGDVFVIKCKDIFNAAE